MFDLQNILPKLRLSSLKDIANKLKFDYRNLERDYLEKRIEDALVPKKSKFHDKLYWKIGFPISISIVFFLLGQFIDISNKEVSDQNTITANKIIAEQRKTQDLVLKKYDLLVSYFPFGYTIYTWLTSGEHYEIIYPGSQKLEIKNYEIFYNQGWRIKVLNDRYEPNNKMRFNDLQEEHSIDLSKYNELQVVSNLYVNNTVLCVMVLDRNKSGPIFAIGLSRKLPPN